MMKIAEVARDVASSRMFRVGHELFWVCVGQGVGALGAIVGVRILTQILTPTAYGELALGLTAATLANQVLLGPLGGAALRYFTPARESSDLSAYFSALRRLVAFVTGVLVVVVCVVALGLAYAGYQWAIPLLFAALMYALLFNYSSVLDGMQNAARQRVVVAWHDGVAPWLRYGAAALLTSLIRSSSAVAMSGYALASTVVLGSQAWFFRRRILVFNRAAQTNPRSTIAWTRRMTGYAWPFTIFGVFTWAQTVSDRWALQAFSTTAIVGQYAVLFQLGYYPVAMGSALLMQLVTPVLFDRAGDGSSPDRLRRGRDLNDRLVLVSLLITACAAVGAFVGHEWIFRVVAAPAYRSVSPMLPWLVLSAGLFCAAQVASLGPLTADRTERLLIPKVLSSMLGIGLNVLGARYFGIPGVVSAGLVCSVVYFLWSVYLLRTTRLDESSAC